MSHSARRRALWPTHAVVLGLYSVLALVLTWPLVTQLTTHLPGIPQWAFDESTFVWNIWTFKDALIDNLRTPLHSELIWYPLGIDLVLYTYNFYHVLASLPLALAVNLPFASNMSLLASTVLSAYGTWLLVVYLLSSEEQEVRNGVERRHAPSTARNVHLAAFVAGVLYAFASNRAVYAALGHYDMVTTQWIPFYALALLRTMDGKLSPPARRRAAILAGIFFAFTGLAEMISALFLAIFSVIVLMVYLVRARADQENRLAALRMAMTALAIAGAVAIVVWSPALIPILHAFRTADFDLKGWGDALTLSTDLLGWFTPTILHPLFGDNIVDALHQVQARALNPELPGFRDINTVFLGWTSLALALVGAFAYRRKVATWIWTSVLFGLFTLGPLLQINGQSQFDLDGLPVTVPLPFVLLHFIPVIKANRAPNRNSVLLMLGLAVLAGYGVYWLLTRLGEWESKRTGARAPGASLPISQSLVVLAAAGLIVFEHLAVPFALSDARIPAVYDQIAADPNAVSVLQIPLGWRNSFGVYGPEQTQLQYYQTAHGKPMLGGNISRAPDFKMDYFQRIPYFQALTAIQFGRPVSPELLDAAKAQAAELAYLYNIGYVVLTPPIPDRLPYADTWQASWDFVKATLPLEAEPFWAQDGIEAYRIAQPMGGDEFRLDLGVSGSDPYRGEGWDEAAVDAPYGTTATWATAAQSRLFVPLRAVDPNAVYTVTLRIHPFAYPDSSPQRVTLTVNDTILPAQTLVDDWQDVSWEVPGSALVDGLNRLDLDWGHRAVPRTVTSGSRQIGTTGVDLGVDADIKAFADGGFIALFDEEGVQTDASAGRHGVNVTVLDAQNGRVRQQVGFDTTANAGESEQLANFLTGIEAGTSVLVASYGDAWTYLTDNAIDGLRAIGADVTRDQLQNQYFAIAGVAGAQPGTASQAVDPNEAFLRVSLNRDRRTLAAAVDWLNVEPQKP